MHIRLFCPHHDDEIFAIPFLLQNRVKTQRITFHFLTRPPQNASLRQSESSEAIGILQEILPDTQIEIAMNYLANDGELYQDPKASAKQLAEALNVTDNELWLVPRFEGGHQDHDAVFLIATVAARKMGIESVFTFPTYSAGPTPFSWSIYQRNEKSLLGPRSIALGDLMTIGRMIRTFRSQWRAQYFLLFHFLIKITFLRRAVFEELATKQTLNINYKKTPLYEIHGRTTAAAFQRCFSGFL